MDDTPAAEPISVSLQRWGVAAPCDIKVRYGSESHARTIGGRRAKSAAIDLWVYQCPFCAGWHLTSTPRANHWHVNTQFRPNTDFEAANGDPFFWDRLVGMDPFEATGLLRRLKTEMVAALEVASSDDRARMVRTIATINEEIIIANERQHRTLWKNAVRNLFGDAAIESIKTEIARLGHEHETAAYERTR
jgi:hypothetical protein